jgi:3D (Asp-Asp-Asp) domain-containing protein/septal ring factor EnvC (AmiA/AmiB activator)
VSGRRTGSAARLAGFSAALVLGGVSAAAAAGPATQTRISSLRSQSSVIATRTHHALLDLYAIDTQLSSAQAHLSSLQAQQAHLRDQQALLIEQLVMTKRTLAVSQHVLAQNLRTLYERGQTNPLAVMLGAQSLDDAVTKLDDLSRIAKQSKQVVDATTAARARLTRLRAAMAVERTQIDAAVTSARRTASELAATRASRVAFISRLRREQQLKSSQIAALEASAVRAEVKSQALQAAAVAGQTPADPPPTTNAATTTATPTPVTSPGPLGGRTITVSSTGYSLLGHTATGLPVGWGVVAVDPAVIPLGTRMTIPGYGEAVAADTGPGVRGADIDIWFPTLGQARAWGRRTVTITLH